MIVVSLMVNELSLWRASVWQIAVVTNKYIPYIVKFAFYKGICQFHFDVKVVKSRDKIIFIFGQLSPHFVTISSSLETQVSGDSFASSFVRQWRTTAS
jgi:hypothetical protein